MKEFETTKVAMAMIIALLKHSTRRQVGVRLVPLLLTSTSLSSPIPFFRGCGGCVDVHEYYA